MQQTAEGAGPFGFCVCFPCSLKAPTKRSLGSEADTKFLCGWVVWVFFFDSWILNEDADDIVMNSRLISTLVASENRFRIQKYVGGTTAKEISTGKTCHSP